MDVTAAGHEGAVMAEAVLGFRPSHRDAAHRPLELAIVVPTLNERDNIVPLIHALDRAMAGIAYEIIVVDDWSTDGTAEIVGWITRSRRDVRMIRRHGRRGLSSAVIEGALSTTAPLVAVIDADMQHDEAVLPAMVRAVAGGADVAIGTRYAPGGSCGAWDATRARGSRAATRLAHLATGIAISDPLSGFFVTRQATFAAAAPHLDGRGFKVLLDLLSLWPAPMTVAEIPYTFRTRSAGESKLGWGVMRDFARLLLVRASRRAWGRCTGNVPVPVAAPDAHAPRAFALDRAA